MKEKNNNSSNVMKQGVSRKTIENSDLQKHMLHSAAGVVGSGVFLGTVSTFINNGDMSTEDSDVLLGQTIDDVELDANNLGWCDGEVPVAHLNTDHMSFSEAFDAARAEVGADGVFEWNGKVFTTCTVEEWNAVSPEQKIDFENHFDFDGNSEPTPVVINGNELRNALDNELIANLDEVVDDFSSEISEGIAESENQMKTDFSQDFASHVEDVNLETHPEAAAEVNLDDIKFASNSDAETEDSDDELVASIDEFQTEVNDLQEDLQTGVSYDDIQLAANGEIYSELSDDDLVASVDDVHPVVDDVEPVIEDFQNVSYDDIQLAANSDVDSEKADDELVASVDNLQEEEVQTDDVLMASVDNLQEEVQTDDVLMASVDNLQNLVDDAAEASNPILGDAGNLYAESEQVAKEDIEDLIGQYRGEISAEDLVDYAYNPEDFVNDGNVDSYDTV